MAKITYKPGNILDEKFTSPTILAHICNDAGKWGKGFVLELSKKWKEPERLYKQLFVRPSDKPLLSLTLLVRVEKEPEVWVANMIAQKGVKAPNNPKPIDYKALSNCLQCVANDAKERDASVVGPRFGAGLSGGDWSLIEKLIDFYLITQGINVTIYDYKP